MNFRVITDNGPRPHADDRTKQKPTGLTAQLLAAVETFGVDDTRAALREIRDRDTAEGTSR